MSTTKREVPPIWVKCHTCRRTVNIAVRCLCPACQVPYCWICFETHLAAKTCDYGRNHIEPVEIPHSVFACNLLGYFFGLSGGSGKGSNLYASARCQVLNTFPEARCLNK